MPKTKINKIKQKKNQSVTHHPGVSPLNQADVKLSTTSHQRDMKIHKRNKDPHQGPPEAPQWSSSIVLITEDADSEFFLNDFTVWYWGLNLGPFHMLGKYSTTTLYTPPTAVPSPFLLYLMSSLSVFLF